jgi:hypothetical protein
MPDNKEQERNQSADSLSFTLIVMSARAPELLLRVFISKPRFTTPLFAYLYRPSRPGRESMNSLTIVMIAFSCFQDWSLCSSQKG